MNWMGCGRGLVILVSGSDYPAWLVVRSRRIEKILLEIKFNLMAIIRDKGGPRKNDFVGGRRRQWFCGECDARLLRWPSG